ncbi:MAG: ATP-grasp domain-containing protein [Planctomycetaceae bacterium]
MNDGSSSLIIIGASARGAAFSALRAGLTPICADLFADVDLRDVSVVHRIERYPHDLPRMLRDLPPAPWMYTGGIENHPRLIEEIAAERELWGTPADAVRRVRDPFHLAAVLRDAGLPALDVRLEHDPPPTDGRWMLKPLASAGGAGVRLWDASAAASSMLRRPHYFQRYAEGPSLAAVFVAFPAAAVLAGVTAQEIGCEPLGARGFTYCGSAGPLRIETRDERRESRARTVQRREPENSGSGLSTLRSGLSSIGQTLHERCGLRGLFGCDFIHDAASDCVWLVEVNPRYTASVEVIEHATGVSLLDLHRVACRFAGSMTGASPQAPDDVTHWRIPAPGRYVQKAILFAERDLIVPCLDALRTWDRALRMPHLADVPAAGERIRAGHPICTVLAAGAGAEECAAALSDRIYQIRAALAAAGGEAPVIVRAKRPAWEINCS